MGGKIPTQLCPLQSTSLNQAQRLGLAISNGHSSVETVPPLYLLMETFSFWIAVFKRNSRQWTMSKIIVILIVTHHHLQHWDSSAISVFGWLVGWRGAWLCFLFLVMDIYENTLINCLKRSMEYAYVHLGRQ
jgi:hypothetical protein